MRWLFFGAFVLASLGVLWSARGDRIFLGSVWSVLCMIGYAAIVRFRAPPMAESEEFADSFYYLGFLLTLVALIGVLLHLSDLNGENLLEGVLRHFGLALTTTVVGLVGRIVLGMFRDTPEDLEDGARRKAEEAYDSLSLALDRMAVEAETFGTSLGTRLNRALSPIDPAVERIVTSAGRIAEGLEPLHVQFGKLQAALERSEVEVGRSVSSFGEVLANSAERTGASVNASADVVQTQLGELRQAVDRLRNQIDEAGEAVGLATQGYGHGLKETTAMVEGAARRLGEVLQQVGGLESGTRASLASLSTTADSLDGSMKSLQGTIAGVAAGLNSQGGQIQGGLAKWEESIGALGHLHDQLIREANEAARATADVRDEVAEGVRVLVHRLSNGTETTAEP